MKTTLLTSFILAGVGSALGDITLNDAAAVIMPGGSSTAVVNNYTPNQPVYFTMTCTMNVQAFKQALITSSESSKASNNEVKYTLFSAALTGTSSARHIGAGIVFRTALEGGVGDASPLLCHFSNPASSTNGTVDGNMIPGWTDGSGWTQSDGSWMDSQVDSWGNAKGISITLSGAVGSDKMYPTSFYLTVLKEDDSVLEYTAPSISWLKFSGTTGISSISVNSDIVDSAYFFKSQVSSAANAQALNMAAITAPEPTTATLSLLALAGLAARRRRKQD